MTTTTPGELLALACIIDPDAFEDAMMQDDLTPSERLHFSQSRERDKIVALNKANVILASLAAKPADEGVREATIKQCAKIAFDAAFVARTRSRVTKSRTERLQAISREEAAQQIHKTINALSSTGEPKP